MTTEEYAKAKRARAVRRRYEALVAAKRCVTCGGQDGRTLEGHTRCAACYKKAYKDRQRVTAQARAEDARRKRERREAFRAAGRCRICGGEDYLIFRGRALCAACQRKRDGQMDIYRESGRMTEAGRQRREARRAAGLCTKCGRHPPEAGHVRCTDCLVRDRMYSMRKRRMT